MTLSALTRSYRDEDMKLARFVVRTRFPGWQEWAAQLIRDARDWNRETLIALKRERAAGV